jgi:hypothetical protein
MSVSIESSLKSSVVVRSKVMVWLSIIILSLLQLVFSLYRYPLAGSDAIAFIPAAINFSNGDGLINNVYHITRMLNGKDAIPYFINYPPLFPMTFGYLLRFTKNIYLNFALLHIALMVVFFLFAEKKFQITKDIIKTSLLILFLFAWNTQLNPGGGRPEALAELGLLALLFIFFRAPGKIKYILSGLLIGLTGFTHPVAGIYAGLIFFLLISIRGFSLKDIIVSLLGGAIALLLVVMLYPYDFLVLIKGILDHAGMITSRSEFSIAKFIHYHFTYPEVSFYFFTFLLFLILVSGSYARLYHAAKHKMLFSFFALFFLITVFFFTFQTIETSYNLYVLFPLFGLFIISKTNIKRTKYLFIFASAFFIFSSSGFLRRAILFQAHLKQGILFEKAKEEMNYLNMSEDKIYVSTSLFLLFDSMSHLTDDPNDISVKYALLQQNYAGHNHLRSLHNFELVNEGFMSAPVFIGPIKIANSLPGYQFATYKRR